MAPDRQPLALGGCAGAELRSEKASFGQEVRVCSCEMFSRGGQGQSIASRYELCSGGLFDFGTISRLVITGGHCCEYRVFLMGNAPGQPCSGSATFVIHSDSALGPRP